MKYEKELEIFIDEMIQIHLKTATVQEGPEGESIISNTFQGLCVRMTKNNLYMGFKLDEDRFTITAAFGWDELSGITSIEEVPEFLTEMPENDDEIH